MRVNSLLSLVQILLFFSLDSNLAFAGEFNSDSLFLRSINAVFTNKTIIIDGIINEDSWAEVEPASNFFQTSPNQLIKPSEETYVKIIYDKKKSVYSFYL